MVHDGGSPSLLDIHPICELNIPILRFNIHLYFSQILTIMGPWSIVRQSHQGLSHLIFLVDGPPVNTRTIVESKVLIHTLMHESYEKVQQQTVILCRTPLDFTLLTSDGS
jgi:hypothetical protein